MPVRKCGSCTLCCTAMAVLELDKPPGVPCKHLTSRGCGIYEDRPKECREFECLWLEDPPPYAVVDGAIVATGPWGDVTQRPDRIGAVPTRVYMNPEGLCLNVDPARPEAWERSAATRRMVERVKAGGAAVVVVSPGLRKVLVTPGTVAFRKMLRAGVIDEDGNPRIDEEGKLLGWDPVPTLLPKAEACVPGLGLVSSRCVVEDQPPPEGEMLNVEGWHHEAGDHKVALTGRTVSEIEVDAERKGCTAFSFAGATYRKIDGAWLTA